MSGIGVEFALMRQSQFEAIEGRVHRADQRKDFERHAIDRQADVRIARADRFSQF